MRYGGGCVGATVYSQYTDTSFYTSARGRGVSHTSSLVSINVLSDLLVHAQPGFEPNLVQNKFPKFSDFSKLCDASTIFTFRISGLKNELQLYTSYDVLCFDVHHLLPFRHAISSVLCRMCKHNEKGE